jgi:hypothetical protein
MNRKQRRAKRTTKTVVSVRYDGRTFSGGVIEAKLIASHLDQLDRFMKEHNLSRSNAIDWVAAIVTGKVDRMEARSDRFMSMLTWLACRGEDGKRIERMITAGGHTLITHINQIGQGVTAEGQEWEDWNFEIEVYPSDKVDVWIPGGSNTLH